MRHAVAPVAQPAEARLWPLPPGRILNMSTGPVEVSRHVLEAQNAAILTPHLDAFWSLHDETISMLGQVLRTRSRILLMHGSIRTGIDVALGNFVQPGTKVLSIVNGFWGELIAQWAEQRGATVTRLVHGVLDPIELQRVADALRQETFDLTTLVHVETNSGLVNPVREVGELVSRTDGLYFVDTACSAGAIELETDRWHIDIQTTGSHKCLAAVPGLAVVSVSPKAWDRLLNGPAVGAYFGFGELWKHSIERAQTPPFTQPTTLVLALRASLDQICRFGIEAWWAAHHTLASGFMDELRAAGFAMLIDESPVSGRREAYSNTVIAVRYPPGVSDEAFRRILLDEFGIFVIGNVGEFAGRSFRVGLMSPAQMEAISVVGTVEALRRTATAARGVSDAPRTAF